MDNGKCCKGTKIFVMILLLLNTFFLGSIWCKLVVQPKCGVKSGKMCPLFGQASKEVKDAGVDLKGSQK